MSSALTPTNQNRRQLPTVLLLRDTFCAQPLAIFCLFAARVYPSLNCLFVTSSSSTIVAKLFFSARSANKRALRLSHSLIIFLNVNIAIRFWCSAAIPAAARDHIYRLLHSYLMHTRSNHGQPTITMDSHGLNVRGRAIRHKATVNNSMLHTSPLSK